MNGPILDHALPWLEVCFAMLVLAVGVPVMLGRAAWKEWVQI